MLIDIVIFSYAKTQRHLEITHNAIRHCELSKVENEFRYTVLESEAESLIGPYPSRSGPYPSRHLGDRMDCDVHTVYMDRSQFNYNRWCNKGVEITEGFGERFVALCNNDLIFHRGWSEKLIARMLDQNAGSGSPLCIRSRNMKCFTPTVGGYIEGYNISQHIAGWCLMFDREQVPRKLENGRLDETCDFFFADNIYGDQLQRNKIKHILCLDSIVEHIEGQTIHNTLEAGELNRITSGMVPVYQQWKEKYDAGP